MKTKIVSAAMCILMTTMALAAIIPNIAADPDSTDFKIGWLMIIDWDADYPAAADYLVLHPDKPSDWNITYEPIWFDEIGAGQCLVSEYDLIVTTGHQQYTFTSQQRAILEEYVSSGGVLWIDDCGEIELDNLPFGYEITFGHYAWGWAYNSPTNHDFTIDLPTHPLMDGVFTMDYDHIRDDRDNSRWFTPFTYWDPHYEVVMSGVEQNFGWEGPAILAAQVGYGKIIATAMDVTCAMEHDDYGPWPLDPWYGETHFDFHLVFNMLNWATQPVFKDYDLAWVTPSSGDEYFIGDVVPLQFTAQQNGTPVSDNT
ncbi:MAG: DUF4159 domain-containing protein, partial [Methanomassiliicoccales archaeon]